MSNTINRRNFITALSVPTYLATTGLASGRGLPQSSGKTRDRLRFAVASDGHFGQPETDFKRFHDEMIGWLNEENQGKGLDFVVLNGDLIHDQPEFLPQVKTYWDRLDVPYFATKGNHDRVSGAVWESTWGYKENSEFERGEYGFVLGTTSNEQGDYLCADVNWLESALKKYEEKKGVFVFLHINQNKATRHGVACSEVAALLEGTKNVLSVFNGHDHDVDNVIYSNDRAYLFDGHVGGSWGTNYRGYRIVEADEQGKVRTYQCNPGAFYVNGINL